MTTLKDFNGNLTILMPTYNSAKSVRTSLEALLASTHVGEILVADGGSTDDTISVIHEISDGRVNILSDEDDGLYDGVNSLIPHISRDFVMFMNSDDNARVEYICLAMKYLQGRDYDFVFGDIQYGASLKRARIQEVSHKSQVYQRMPFPHVSVVLRSDLFRKVGPFDLSFPIAADLDFINRMLKLSTRGKYLGEVAANCADDGLSSGNRQVWESMHLAAKHGRPWIVAFAIASAIAVYRKIGSLR